MPSMYSVSDQGQIIIKWSKKMKIDQKEKSAQDRILDADNAEPKDPQVAILDIQYNKNSDNDWIIKDSIKFEYEHLWLD